MPLGGFLLNDDAVNARQAEFDQWVDDQKRQAQQAAQQAAQTVAAPVQAAGAQINANVSQFDQWAQEQRDAAAAKLAQSQTPPQPAAQPAIPTIPTAPAAPSTLSAAGSPETTGPSPLEQFDSWATEQRAQAQRALEQAASGAAQAGSNLGGFAGQASTGAGAALGGLIDDKASQLDNAVKSTGTTTQPGAPAGQPNTTNAVMSTSQFGDSQLTAAEAYAACGPAAAVRFAQFFGRNPTLREATDMAAQVGWNSGSGMAGISSEKSLMDKIGIPTHQVGANWDAIAKEAQTGNPVTISTAGRNGGHYFFADGYDPNTGAFHVGRSGLDLVGGSEWMTPDQMQAKMGQLQGALFADNPNVPSQGGQAQGTPAKAQTTPAAGPPASGIDASSPAAFAKSFAPYAAYAAQKLGVDPSWVTAMSASESNYGKADAAGHELFGVKALPGQPGTSLATHEGEYGGTNMNQTFAAYDSPLDAVNAWVDLIKNHYPGAFGAKDLATFVHGLKSGGYFTAAEAEYLNNLSSIQSRLGSTTNDAIQAAGGVASAAQQAGAQALSDVTGASGAVAQRAEDVKNQGQTALLELQNQLRSSQSALDLATQDAAARNQKWRDQIAAQTEQTRQDLLAPRDFSFLDTAKQSAQDAAQNIARNFPQSAQDTLGSTLSNAPSPAGGTLGQNLQDIQNAPQNLSQLAQGTQAFGAEAQRRQTEDSPYGAGLSLAEAVSGQQVPEAVRSSVLNAPAPAGAGVPDISGPLSSFLKTAQIVPSSVTVNLPVLGPTPLADILGQAANFAIPIGAEERFAGSVAQRAADRAAFQATHDATQFGWSAALGSAIPQVRDAARAAVSGAGRWVRGSVEDVMADLAKTPIGDLVRDEAGTLDVDKLRQIATEVKDQVTRMYHGTGADFPSPTADRLDPNALFGPGYYVTSSPEVAGGNVSRGNFGINPETGTTSTYDRATGKFTTYMENVGKLLSPGYAQQRTQFDESSIQDLLGRVMDDMHDSRGYFGAGAQEQVRKLFNNEGYRANLTPQDKHEALLAALSQDAPNPQRYLSDLAPDIMGQGGNVRAVDVPQNLNLFNVDAPVPPGLVERVQAFLDEHNPLGADAFVPDAEKPLNQLTGADLYRELERASGEPYTDRGYANQVLAQLGFDGITYQGGQRIPMRDAAGNAIEHQANVIFPESLDKVRNAISMRQGGQADPRLALRLAGGVGGVVSQEGIPGVMPGMMSDQDKQDPWGRFGRDVAAGVLGSAAPGTALALAQRAGPSYADIAGLRPGVTHLPGTPQTGAQLISALTKQNLLSGPKTHITNILTQLAELARNPVTAAVGGREDEAVAGLKAMGQAMPDAISNFAKTLSSGQTQMSAGFGTTPKYLPAMRFLSATDDFFRTLGWAMGAGQEGQRFLRENPGAVPSAVLAANRTAIDEAGQKMGRLSVFGEGKGIAGGFSEFKNRLLSSSSVKDQIMGSLWDALVPFSGVPDRIWNIGIQRTPGVGELTALGKAGFKFAKGDTRGAQQAVGDALQQSVVSAAILSNIANGNIRGPDDPEHPSSVRINGQWVDYSSWGPWALPMAWPAAIYEAAQKEGNKPNPNLLKAAADATGKVLADQSYAGDLIKTLSQISGGSGWNVEGATAAGYLDRYLPAGGALNQATALWDPVLRDTTRDNPLLTVLARQQAKIPGLAGMLPAQPELTSGQPQERRSSGPGEFIGLQTRPQSKLDSEVARLERANYSISNPSRVPTSISLGGATIPLTDDEQRQVAEARGKLIDQATTPLMNSSSWDGMSDQQKALSLNAIMSSIDGQNAALWAQMTAPAELQRRMSGGQKIAGKLQTAGTGASR